MGYRTTHNGVEIFQDTILLQEERLADKTFSVGYYPLTGENADYTGMAACYRQYLQGAGLLKKSTHKQQPYHITLIGGAQAREFTLGIPHTSLLPLTTFAQSQQIVKELRGLTGQTPEVLLMGYGASGLDVGKLAGGFTFAGELGNKASQNALEAFCREQGIPLFTDFDVARFNQSGNGFNPLFSSATAASTDNVTYYPLKRNVRAEDTENRPFICLNTPHWARRLKSYAISPGNGFPALRCPPWGVCPIRTIRSWRIPCAATWRSRCAKR